MHYNRLKAAAQVGDIDLLYTLIQEDPDVLEHIDVIPFVDTPLHVAASAGHLHFATEIMTLKPSFAWKLNQQGLTPIHLAIQHGHHRMVLCFVDINKDLVRVKGREGLTPLHIVSQTGEIDLLAHFLNACPDSIEDVTVRSETALHIAVKYRQYQVLQILVGWLERTTHMGAERSEKSVSNSMDDNGNTILHISALMSDAQALGLLINSNRMDLNVKNVEKSTALDIAQSEETRSKLVRAGAKPGSSGADDSKLADELKSKMTVIEKIMIRMHRIRRDILEKK